MLIYTYTDIKFINFQLCGLASNKCLMICVMHDSIEDTGEELHIYIIA
jgi:hypothetical protein